MKKLLSVVAAFGLMTSFAMASNHGAKPAANAHAAATTTTAEEHHEGDGHDHAKKDAHAEAAPKAAPKAHH